MQFSCGFAPSQAKLIRKRCWWHKVADDLCYFHLGAPVHIWLAAPSVKRRLIPVTGSVIFTAAGDTFFGGPRSKHYRSGVIDNPTYSHLLEAARVSQKKTCDYHHRFLEGVHFERLEHDNGRVVLALSMEFGS